jgi:2,4-dienoyl-CoA reductase-like NADH-dependent reductase (Old Yellow Enzyme family)
VDLGTQCGSSMPRPARVPQHRARHRHQVGVARGDDRLRLFRFGDQAQQIIASGDADMVAMARAMLWDPRWPWHAAAKLGAQVPSPVQYWRSAPRDAGDVLANAKIGAR